MKPITQRPDEDDVDFFDRLCLTSTNAGQHAPHRGHPVHCACTYEKKHTGMHLCSCGYQWLGPHDKINWKF